MFFSQTTQHLTVDVVLHDSIGIPMIRHAHPFDLSFDLLFRRALAQIAPMV
jgi:hypothetical protein